MAIKKIIFLILTSIMIMSAMPSATSQSNSSEYTLKAAFLYRFTDYIEWTTNNDSQTFNVGVLGESPIINSLNEIARDKRVKSKVMTIKRCDNFSDVASCQILFVPRNAAYSLETILSKVGNRQILIVTEQLGYGSKGAHINFLTEENRLKFEVNLRSVTAAGLRISSQLLQHAVIVGKEDE